MSDIHFHIPAPTGGGDLHVHLHLPGSGAVLAAIQQLSEQMTMNQAELKDALTGLATDVGDISTTLGASVTQLEKATNEIILAISNQGSTTPEVDAALANLKAAVAAMKAPADAIKGASQALDDMNVDQPTP